MRDSCVVSYNHRSKERRFQVRVFDWKPSQPSIRMTESFRKVFEKMKNIRKTTEM